jgi:hypothetical protein
MDLRVAPTATVQVAQGADAYIRSFNGNNGAVENFGALKLSATNASVVSSTPSAGDGPGGTITGRGTVQHALYTILMQRTIQHTPYTILMQPPPGTIRSYYSLTLDEDFEVESDVTVVQQTSSGRATGGAGGSGGGSSASERSGQSLQPGAHLSNLTLIGAATIIGNLYGMYTD